MCELRDLCLRLKINNFEENTKVEIASPNGSINTMLESTGVGTLSCIKTMYSLLLRIPKTLIIGKRTVVLKAYSILFSKPGNY